MRHGNDRTFVDAGMFGQDFFKLQRGNILSATDDNVLHAVNDEKIAILIDGGHISGMEPSAAQSLSSGFGLEPIALHNSVAASNDFSGGLTVVGYVLALSVYHSQFDAWNRVTGHRLSSVALAILPANPSLCF